MVPVCYKLNSDTFCSFLPLFRHLLSRLRQRKGRRRASFLRWQRRWLDLTHCMANAPSKRENRRTSRDGFSEREAPTEAAREKPCWGFPWKAPGFVTPTFSGKKSNSYELDFSFVPLGTTSFACVTQHHLSLGSTSLPPTAQMNDVAPLVQMMCFAMMWACAQRCCASRNRTISPRRPRRSRAGWERRE